MLREAKGKIKKEGLKNASLLCKDATNTRLQDELFDYIIIGLVLHECNEELWKGILNEAHRILKNNGKLLVLEWDKQNKVSRKMKFAPLYLAEVLVNPRFFKKFYDSDKNCFF